MTAVVEKAHPRLHSSSKRSETALEAMLRWKQTSQVSTVCLQLQLIRSRLDHLNATGRGALFLHGPDLGQWDLATAATCWANPPLAASPMSLEELLAAFRTAEGRRPVLCRRADLLFENRNALRLLAQAVEGAKFTWRRGKKKQGIHLRGPLVVATELDPRTMPTSTVRLFPELWSHHTCITLRGDRQARWECLISRALFTDWLIGRCCSSKELVALDRALKWFTMNLWNLQHVDAPGLKTVFDIHVEHVAGQITDLQLPLLLDEMKRAAMPSPKEPPRNEEWAKIREAHLEHDRADPADK